jgi:hypothetical protein
VSVSHTPSRGSKDVTACIASERLSTAICEAIQTVNVDGQTLEGTRRSLRSPGSSPSIAASFDNFISWPGSKLKRLIFSPPHYYMLNPVEIQPDVASSPSSIVLDTRETAGLARVTLPIIFRHQRIRTQILVSNCSIHSIRTRGLKDIRHRTVLSPGPQHHQGI